MQTESGLGRHESDAACTHGYVNATITHQFIQNFRFYSIPYHLAGIRSYGAALTLLCFLDDVNTEALPFDVSLLPQLSRDGHCRDTTRQPLSWQAKVSIRVAMCKQV